LHRQLPRTRACTLLVAVALAAVALFQLGRGQGRRHQGQAAGRVHSGRPRAKPGAGPVLDRGGPAARWRVAASRSPITGAIRSRLRQGHHRRRPGRRGQLAKVAARAYDTVGIDSFQALLGLLLIDDQMLERRGPEATCRARCWWGSGSLAWLGWRCCPRPAQPPGLSRPLVAVRTTGHPHRRSGRRRRRGDLHLSAPPPRVSPRRTAPEARRSRTRSERDQLERV
jgi:hypothetical protein